MPNTSKIKAAEFLEERSGMRSGFPTNLWKRSQYQSDSPTLEESLKQNTCESLPKSMYSIASVRARTARAKGGDLSVCESVFGEDPQKKGKILIVDSDSANRNVIKTFLENLKYDVVTAADGEEALDISEKEMPDLVVTEIMLPKIDGFVLCEKLNLHSSAKNIPFIIVSNLKNEDSVKRAISLGIEHYFQKPYMLSELLGIIQLKFKGDGMNEDRY